jgi:energy-coupling factor transporter ATP-binding protein EcfA2
MKIRVSTQIPATPRAAMLRGLFDIPEATESIEEWETTFENEITARPWNIGLITGPSGCGKSTITKQLWPTAPTVQFEHDQAPIIEAFPTGMPLREITEILSSVGFSSPPAWLRPYHVLSTGQKFRTDIALALAIAEPHTPIVCDEYTSVVDRTVAQIGSAAAARTIRKRNLQFIAVTCHNDIEEWLQPDWVYLPAENKFSWRSLRRRPAVGMQIFRCHTTAWQLYAHHHYLSTDINPAAQCWMATIASTPVAFSAWLHFFGRGQSAKREHRTVCLPDYQGIGIGNRISATIASMWTALGFRALSTTTHPGMIASRQRSPEWKLTRAPSLGAGTDTVKHATTRLTAGFAYVGPPMKRFLAEALLK